MSGGINKVIIIGRLGRDPEVRYTASGDAVASIALATSKKYKDRQGELQEKTEWHHCTAWRKAAEVIGQYCKKGDRIYIEGELTTEKWDKNGIDSYSTKINILNFELLGGNSSGNQAKKESYQHKQNQVSPEQAKARNPEPAPDFDFDDDVPF
jgi:single-strand DNA-binding protein